MCFRSAFVQSHAQSQARVMFVNCYQNGQLGLYQNQCIFKKIHSLYVWMCVCASCVCVHVCVCMCVCVA